MLRGPLERCEENARYSFAYILLAEFQALSLFCFPGESHISPQKRMFSTLKNLSHALTDGSENFGFAQVWDQQPKEHARVGGRAIGDISARAGAALH